jgi:hypothetical protein
MITSDESNDMFADWEKIRAEVTPLYQPNPFHDFEFRDLEGMTREEIADYLDEIDKRTKARLTPDELRRRRRNQAMGQ